MSNVIHVDFSGDENSGYLISDGGKVDGVYCGDLGCVNDNGVVYIGAKNESGIENPVQLSIDDINEFCLMWLLIFNPDVIVE